MRTPTEAELRRLYDSVKSHESKHLTHLKVEQTPKPKGFVKTTGAKAQQKNELQARIQSLSEKLRKLDALITQRENEVTGTNQKSKAKKERAAKEKDKPKTAAEKAKMARENGANGSNSDGKSSNTKTHSVPELKSLAIKVKGQAEVAKQKLAAL